MTQQFYIGIVENRIGDPLKLGRCQVRVFGVHTEVLTDIPTADLPWAIPLMPATSASLSGVGHSVSGYLEGTMVFVFFQDGESKQQPIILGSAHGIPLDKSPFNQTVTYDDTTTVSTADTSSTGAVTSSDGTPVTDSSGTAVQTGTAEPTPTDGLDITKMVSKYGSNVTTVFQTIKDFGITDNYAIVAILSNIAKECKFKPVRESMKYSSISRLKEIFKTKFPPLKTPEEETVAYSKYVNNEELLSNLVYSNRIGNGNPSSGDGYKYRGGGYIQLTGRSNYQDIGKSIGVDLVNNPELIVGSGAAKAAVQYFINRFGGAKKLSFNSLDEALQTVTKKVNPGGFSNDYPIVVTASKLCTVTVSEEKKAEAEAVKEATSPNDPSNSVDTSATPEQINSGTTSKAVSPGQLGFKDPASRYPLSSYLKEPDTNRLSRSSFTATAVETKQKNRRSSIRSIGGNFAEPGPAFNGVYPFNHVYATESGHLQEFDDTAGSERIHTYHKSGTFSEVDSFGTQVNKIIGDSFSITERNGYIYIDGTARITVGSDVKMVIAGNLDIEVDGNMTYDVGGDITFKAGGSVLMGAGSDISGQSAGGIAFDGATINLNSGSSTPVTPRGRSGVSNDYPVQTPESASASASIVIEDVPAGEASDHIDAEIKSGNIAKKDIDDGNAAAEKPETVDETPPTTKEPIPASCAIFEGKTVIPDSQQISKYYTIGMVSTNTAVSHYKVKAQQGLSAAEVACNLKKVAENCLDVIKAKYPKMIVTSGFRHGTGSSQHTLGQAIDMQFGVSNSEYFEIATWIKNNVLFDQLLLEYKTIETGNAWIHVSYKDNPRKVVYTYMNHKNAGTGLRKLQ